MSLTGLFGRRSGRGLPCPLRLALPLLLSALTTLTAAPAAAQGPTFNYHIYLPVVMHSSGIAGVQVYNITQRAHITGPIAYPQTPPVGGDHWDIWLNCGFYDQPVPNEEAVHSMEHGAVWITRAPDLPAAQVDSLHDVARAEFKTIVSPYVGLPAPVVITAWDFQLYLPSASDPRLLQFLHTYREGLLSGEPHGECTGGDGNPLP